MIFQSIKTTELNKNLIDQILNLKESHWKYGKESQLKWFDKFTQENDLHNFMIMDKEIHGYTSLSQRSCKEVDLSNNVKNSSYILFTTLIINKKVRNYSSALNMMKFNNRIISKTKKPSFLLCHKNLINFYKYFGWSLIGKKDFNVPDHKSSLIGMTYNFTKLKNFFYNFYYYS